MASSTRTTARRSAFGAALAVLIGLITPAISDAAAPTAPLTSASVGGQR